jgi:hypothetical protein
LIVSDRRKRVTNSDVIQIAGVSTQTASRVMNKSYVLGKIGQCANAVMEQYNIPKSFYFYSSRRQSLYDHPLLFVKANQV